MKALSDIQRTSISPFGFVIRIVAMSVGLVLIANLIASGFNLHFGLALFILGILAMSIGNVLSLPARRYERRSGIRHINLFQLPTPEEYVAEKLFVTRRAIPFYSFENAMLLSGFTILAIGLIILF
jgi:hypothetical protein